MNTKEIDFVKYGEEIWGAECACDIPFDVKRLYYIYNVKGSDSRGAHAHKELDQVFVMIKGACTMFLDDGIETKSIRMDNSTKALFVGKRVWHEMTDFSEDAIFVAFASAEYSESDYIRNYQEFKRYIGVDRE